ncbi:MAG: phosphoglucosamine mutase, partial [Burkholderiales bacterium]
FDPLKNTQVCEAVAQAESALDGSGRVVLRNSGTEPVVRVMVEGSTQTKLQHCADVIAQTVRNATAR